MPNNATKPRPARRARLRTSGGFKCLLCYAVCFLLPLLFEAAALKLIYPYRLASTAPAIAANIAEAFPSLGGLLAPWVRRADIAAAADPQALELALNARDAQWLAFLGGLALIIWAATLLVQLVWRFTHRQPVMAARATTRAIRDYRISMLVIIALNALGAACVWFAGVRFIGGRGLWDYLAYFTVYALNILAALICFRLAAPPTLSGRGAFFRRL